MTMPSFSLRPMRSSEVLDTSSFLLSCQPSTKSEKLKRTYPSLPASRDTRLSLPERVEALPCMSIKVAALFWKKNIASPLSFLSLSPAP